MKPTVALRPATTSDFEFAWSLYRQVMRDLTEELGAWNEAEQRRVVESAFETGETSVIVADGKDAGWVQVRDEGERIRIEQLHVRPEHQGRGVGTSVLREVQERARRGGQMADLSVMRNNLAAQRLYQRLGFRLHVADPFKLHMRWTTEP